MSKPISDFQFIEDREYTSISRKKVLENNPLYNFENRYVTKSGKIVWLSLTSMPITDGELIYAIAKNVTHHKKMEEERNVLLTKFTKLNNDLKKLSYTNSHDLRAPVNNLLAIFSILDLSKIEDDETLHFLGLLQSSIESLKETLNSYVDLLVLEDNTTADIEEIDFNESLTIILLSINSLIQNSNAVIKIDFSQLEKVNFNKYFLESIFLNLLTNAVKYAIPGQAPSISISSRKIDGIDQLIFSDKRAGFNMDLVKDKIFGYTKSSATT